MQLSAPIGIIGCGKYIPKNLVTNKVLAHQCNVTTNWIEERTGIKTRYYASSTESASMMATAASRSAIKNANIKAEDIGLIICCSYSGDYLLPPLACKIQHMLNAKHAGAFDICAGSAGFEIAITIGADRLTLDPGLKHVLVVTSAVQSPFLDQNNPQTAVLFGDAAAAAVLSFVPKGYGLLGTQMFSKGEAFDAIRLRGGGSSFPLRQANTDHGAQYIEMNGLAVGKQYIRHLPVAIERILKKTGLAIKDIDLFIFHQANLKMIQFLMSKLRLDMKKTFTDVEIYGNTSDASIALALCDAVEKKVVRRGDRILLAGVGAGMTFASSVLRWF